jgi:hypothetical protein
LVQDPNPHQYDAAQKHWLKIFSPLLRPFGIYPQKNGGQASHFGALDETH